MLFRNVNMSAFNAIFQTRPKAFEAVDVRIALNVFANAMFNGLVIVANSLQPSVRMKLVRVYRGAFDDIFFNDRLKGLSRIRGNYFGHDLPATLQHSENDSLVFGVATAHAAPFSANVGFVHFNIAKQGKLAIHFGNVFANLMAHAPRALVRHAKLSFEFLGRYVMPRRGKEVDGVEPELQGRAAILKGSANRRVEMMPAPLAGIGPFRLNLVPVRLALAFRAGMALAKAYAENVLKAGIVRGELLEKVPNRDAGLFLLFGGLRLHGANL